MNENEISQVIVTSAVEVHRTLGGPSLLESVYEEALAWELNQQGISVERQKPIIVLYKGEQLSAPFRVDLLVAGKVIFECKAVRQHNDIFEAQLLTYLRLSNLRLGLLINFGEKLVSKGIKRVVNGLDL